jgi:hypothetical protein
MTKRLLPYEVRWTDEAWAEVNRLRTFERRPVIQAADELTHQ